MRIDETLLNEAKAYAARHGRSLTSVMEDALRQLLNRSTEAAERPPVVLPLSGDATGPKLTWAEIKEMSELDDIERVFGGARHADA
ncbi:DUF6364 family protein [Nonomuraea sp. LPB2021202275-12-8]|uniref:DUF6364 family protein n=1 Tax=Nonomuraea sp. LPB2021202275-12-8 TaxID=3120159 RepID=UPI00300CA32A